MLKIIITLCVFVGASVNAQRVAPGVPPQHYQPQQHQQLPQHQQHPPPPQQYQQVHQQNHLPPGVSPQQYQQQQQVQYQQVPVQQQQQQMHVQQPVQQMPVQQIPVHQQVPVQQVPVQQVPVQQVPVQQQQVPVQVPQGHGGHHAPHHVGHANHGQVLNAANIQNEKEHIQEHLHVPIDTSKMSEAELQFHYFKMHDSDNNNKLDGCELIKSLIHWHVDEEKDKATNKEEGGGTGEKNGTTYTDDNLADVIDYVLNTMDLNKDGYVDYTEYRKSEEESEKANKQ